MRVSVILPVRNEEKVIAGSVRKLSTYLSSRKYDYEIIIVDDASEDGTYNVVKKIEKESKNIKIIHLKERVGKGKSVEIGFVNSSGDILVFMDADLSANLSDLEKLIAAIEKENYDIAVGSRLLDRSKVKRPLKRKIPSKIYNALVRILFSSKIRDHQCGFKALKRNIALNLIENIKDNHWFWDTELLILAQREGAKIKEVPITWIQSSNSKVNVLSDGFYLLLKLLEMKFDEIKYSRTLFLLSLLILAFIFIFLFYNINFSLFVRYMFSLNPLYFFIAAVVYFSSFILRGFRYEYLLNKLGFRTSVFHSVKAIFVGQTVNVVTPAKLGDAVRIYIFKLRGVPYTISISSLVFERFFDVIVILIFAILSSFFFDIRNTYKFVIYFILVVLLGSALFLFLTTFLKSKRKIKIAENIKNLLKFRIVALTVFLTVGVWLLDSFVCYLLLLSFGKSDIILSIFAVVVANIVKILPLTPGGIGQYEMAIFSVLALKLDKSLALLVAIVDHGLKNFVTIVFGFLSVNLMNLKISNLIEIKQMKKFGKHS